MKQRFTRDDWERPTRPERILRLRRLAEEARQQGAAGPAKIQRAYRSLAEHWARLADDLENTKPN